MPHLLLVVPGTRDLLELKVSEGENGGHAAEAVVLRHPVEAHGRKRLLKLHVEVDVLHAVTPVVAPGLVHVVVVLRRLELPVLAVFGGGARRHDVEDVVVALELGLLYHTDFLEQERLCGG